MASVRTYTIRHVDADEFADDIQRIEDAVELPRCPYDGVQWWLAFFQDYPVAYLGLMPSTLRSTSAYLVRVGVLKEHRGNSLQYRLMCVAERFARRQCFVDIISDTYDNPPSANNLIRAGYKTFTPDVRWAFADGIYWRKVLQP